MFGGWLLLDSLHTPLSGGLTVVAAAGAWWWWRRPRGPITPQLPSSWAGWIERCEGLLPQFEQLESATTAATSAATTAASEAFQAAQQLRRDALEQLRGRQHRQALDLGLVGLRPLERDLEGPLVQGVRAPLPITLHWGHPLASHSPDWSWPAPFLRCDLLLHAVHPPLQAADLRWLEALPAGQPVWLLVAGEGPQLLADLQAQLPAHLRERLLPWSGEPEALAAALAPLAQELRQQGHTLLHRTEQRLLERLHGDWQGALERLRRERCKALVQRTQWLVAAGVFAAPLPSMDLLVLAVANGLMLQEMARLWDCPWGMEQLRAAATELARAALALGVVEWTGQALTSVMRLEGSAWLVGSSLQALSGAYLTRVVARAMTDVLALSSGVAEADLQAIRLQAPLLVARAAESERLDWPAFLQQGRQWVLRQATA
ncbi:YcjF family protein [Synechococcus sp. ATX 2A4]|nr:YcjF family protein [Synechococcus sp. ATX 2A4]